MPIAAIQKLRSICHHVPVKLTQISEAEFTYRPAPHKWSKKEILGHLIDSATNNHQRFVRAQFEETPLITYDQEKWNACSKYNQLETHELIQFWTSYNLHLAALISSMTAEELLKMCQVGAEEPRTVEYLFIDYVAHLEHHLKQIVDY